MSRMSWSENAKLNFGETLCDGTSHMGGSHYLINFTKNSTETQF